MRGGGWGGARACTVVEAAQGGGWVRGVGQRVAPG